MGDENPCHTLRDYSRPRHEGYRNTIEFPDRNDFAPLQSDTIRRTIDQAADGKLRNKNDKESLALSEDLALYDNKSCNELRDFAKPVKAISMPQDVSIISNWRMLELEDQIKLTNEKLSETDVRLALASNSHIYPLEVAKDVLVEVSFVYPLHFMILDIKEDVKKPFILETSFLTMARVEIKFDKGTISLRSEKSTVQFHICPDPFTTLEERGENMVNTLSIVNERVLE
uniref:MAK10-like protein n=1 Tax=Tanacetum cinerariifolium TaxID=118510 RepID=A0A699HTF0_TANCI|nr:MAK10-like protein [Tanacetum cinerariifolium]